jgi:hypothetical protein
MHVLCTCFLCTKYEFLMHRVRVLLSGDQPALALQSPSHVFCKQRRRSGSTHRDILAAMYHHGAVSEGKKRKESCRHY